MLDRFVRIRVLITSLFVATPMLLFPATSQASPILDPANGHYYELVSSTTANWAVARDAAAASSYLGLTGYLATITSQAEEAFVENLLPSTDFSDYWIGGSDAASEGVWRWVTGPEAGTQFWQGDTSGTAVNGAYEDWERHLGVIRQPDNTGVSPGEDFLTIERYTPLNDLPFGWNDAADGNGFRAGYIVEYSELPEPGTLTLVGLSLGFALRARRKRSHA